MTAPQELLDAAVLRIDLAIDTLANARQAIVAAAELSPVAQTARVAIEGDGWPRGLAEFGAAVRAAREACGLTRERLAARAGLVAKTIQNVERGRHRCTSTTRALLVKVLVSARS
jgi:DNA-binding XRE family transcriptional regulator